MAYSSEAYDFELFENISDSAVRKNKEYETEAPAPQKKQKAQIVELPQVRKHKKHSLGYVLKNAVRVSCILVVFALIAGLLYSQAQLDELTDELSTYQSTLSEEESIGVQLTSRLAEKYTDAYVESFVGSNLEMRKVTQSQIAYLSVFENDSGAVLQKSSEDGVFEKLFNSITSIFK